MGQKNNQQNAPETELDMTEIVPEFGVTRAEIEAEVERRLAEPGQRYTSEELTEILRRKTLAAKADLKTPHTPGH